MLLYPNQAADQQNRDVQQALADGAPWRSLGECGPHADLFFGPDDHTEYKRERLEREAKAVLICAGCEVQEPCLEKGIHMKDATTVRAGIGTDQLRAIIGSQKSKKR